MARKKNFILSFSFLVICALAVALLFSYGVDFGGNLVFSAVSKAAASVGAAVSVSAFSGNPIAGFHCRGVGVSVSGDRVATAREVAFDISFASLLTGSLKLAHLSFNGVSADVTELMAHFGNIGEVPASDILIGNLLVTDSHITSAYGAADIDSLEVRINNANRFYGTFKGRWNGEQVSFEGDVVKKGDLWSVGKLLLDLDGGKLSVTGDIFPALNVKLSAERFSIGKLAAAFPAADGLGVNGILTAETSLSCVAGKWSAKGSGNLQCAKYEGIRLSKVAASWQINNGDIEVTLDSGEAQGSSFSGYFKLAELSGSRHIDLKLSVDNLNFSDWHEALQKGIRVKGFGLLGGKISSVRADFSGPIDAPSGKVTVAPSVISYGKLVFKQLKGSIVCDGKPCVKVDFSALHNGGNVTLTGTAALAPGFSSDLNLKTETLSLSALAGLFPSLAKIGVKGDASLSASLSGPSGAFLIKAEASSPSVSAGKLGEFSDVKVLSVYKPSEKLFSLSNISLVWNGARSKASGKLSFGDKGSAMSLQGTFSGASVKKFHTLFPFLKDIGINAVLSGTFKASGPLEDPTVLVSLAAPGGRFRGLAVDKFSSDLLFAKGRLNLDPITIQTAGGRIKAKAVVDLPVKANGKKPQILWKLDAVMENLSAWALKGLLNVSGDATGKISGSFSMGNRNGNTSWLAKLSADKLGWNGFIAESVKADISASGREVRINSAAINFLKGSHTLEGTILLPKPGAHAAETVLNFHCKSKGVNLYDLLRRYMPKVRGVQGLAEAEFTVGGTVGAPMIEGRGLLSPFRYRGFLLPEVDLAFTGGLDGVNVTKAVVRLDRGTLSGSGSVKLYGSVWHSYCNLSGRDIDMQQVGAYLPDRFRKKFGGRCNIDFSGGGASGSFEGRGSFSSNVMKVMGLLLLNVNAPFFVTNGYAIVEDVSAELNGGTVSGGVALDIGNSAWGGNITVMSADVKPTLQQAIPDMKGSVSGKGDIKLRAQGEVGRMSTIKAGGVVLLSDGEVTSFDAVEAAKKFTNGKPLVFKSVQLAYTFDGGDLTILPGTQAVAPEGNSFYRYFMLDGLISRKKEMSLFMMGKLNIRALNALLGALQGAIGVGADITSGTVSDKEIAQAVFGGLLSGMAKSDFRFVTMNVKGTTSSPAFDNIKVDPPRKQGSAKDVIPELASDPNDDGNIFNANRSFKLKFEIPMGPGNMKTPDDVSGQMLEQALGNILRNIETKD